MSDKRASIHLEIDETGKGVTFSGHGTPRDYALMVYSLMHELVKEEATKKALDFCVIHYVEDHMDVADDGDEPTDTPKSVEVNLGTFFEALTTAVGAIKEQMEKDKTAKKEGKV